MKNVKVLMLFIPIGMNSAYAIDKAERPNILCLTFEDSSANLFGCYGGRFAHTPNIDRLAAEGIQYMNAWSVAPQSSPARSSLITGCYATTYAMDLHRIPQNTPNDILFPQLLKQAGYYCTNNSKTDYNTFLDHKSCWDDCSKTASYNNVERKLSQPFFAVFNCMASHMGRIRSFHLSQRRDYSAENIWMNKLEIPTYLPDQKEVRSDYAGHLESIQDIDQWITYFLRDLEEKKLEDNTIIFFFSDHGGCLPRGKGYLYESGLRVPFIVYLPPKWQHLFPDGAQKKNDRLIDFTDFAPTILSLAGIEKPAHMQGKAFLGNKAEAPKKYNYAFTTNQHHVYMPSRAISDGQFKYVRRYISYKYQSLRNYYQWGMPSNMAWDSLVFSKAISEEVLLQPYFNQGSEMLFNLEVDPYELNNLINDRKYEEKVIELRSELMIHIRRTKDLGFFIPSSRGQQINLYDKVRTNFYPLDMLYNLIDIASNPTINDEQILADYLDHNDKEFRFWASVGLGNLSQNNELNFSIPFLKKRINDEDDYVASEACYALVNAQIDIDKAMLRLVNPTNDKYRKAGYSLLEVLSFDTKNHKLFNSIIPELEKYASAYNIKDNEDAGLIARGILVNLKLIFISNMYGDDAFKLGVSINKGRRKKLPLP